MICLALGLGLLGVVAMRRAHRRCHGHDGYGWHGPWGFDGHHHHGGRRSRAARWMLHGFLSRIDATPAQERAIVGEITRLQERVWTAKHGIADARGDLAAAVRGPVLDDAALGAVLGRVDAATGEARGAVVDALRNIHGLLDDNQRSQVADMLDRSGGWWRTGPYR